MTEFVQEIVTTLSWVTNQSKDMKNANDSVREFLDRALATYGRSSSISGIVNGVFSFYYGILHFFTANH